MLPSVVDVGELRSRCAQLDEDYYMGDKTQLVLVILVMLSLFKDDLLWVNLVM